MIVFNVKNGLSPQEFGRFGAFDMNLHIFVTTYILIMSLVSRKIISLAVTALAHTTRIMLQ